MAFEKYQETLGNNVDNFTLNDIEVAYNHGWHDGDEFQLDCHQDHEKYKLERLRDQFAMAALPITLQSYWDEVNRGRPVDPDWRDGNAMEAYAMADAMLKVRNGAE